MKNPVKKGMDKTTRPSVERDRKKYHRKKKHKKEAP